MSSRGERREIAEQTLRICEEGVYATEDGRECNISESVNLAIKNSEHLPPTTTFNIPSEPSRSADDGEEETEGENVDQKPRSETVIQITDESTLECARRLHKSKEFRKIVILNFASAKNPGGGFMKGSQAQEESIARSSALYVCVADSQYYEVNRKTKNGLYTNWMVYTPGCPVFRDSMTNQLIEPYEVNIITCPAVNAGVFLKRGGSKEELERVMKKRMDRIIRLALYHENDAIVLGAYGCGVFKNRLDFVAQHFKFLIEERYKGYFKNVTYAILGKSFKVFGDCYQYGVKAYNPGKNKKKKKKVTRDRNRGRGGNQREERRRNQRERTTEKKKNREKKYTVFE